MRSSVYFIFLAFPRPVHDRIRIRLLHSRRTFQNDLCIAILAAVAPFCRSRRAAAVMFSRSTLYLLAIPKLICF